MDSVSIVLIAIGLSMDAFAIALTYGMVTKQLRIKDVIKVSVSFAALQTISPVIGWLAGMKLQDYITLANKWIAFFLLSLIGIKMIVEFARKRNMEEKYTSINFKSFSIIVLAVSIDELAAGLSFAFLQISIINLISVIGIITFIMSTIGILSGKKFGKLLKDKAELVGGAIFILIGLKNFFE